MSTEARPLAELTQEAIHLLYREMGVVNTVRVLRQFTTGYGNYVEDRAAIFAGKSVTDIVSDIERRRKA
jgi:hypothetical protein